MSIVINDKHRIKVCYEFYPMLTKVILYLVNKNKFFFFNIYIFTGLFYAPYVPLGDTNQYILFVDRGESTPRHSQRTWYHWCQGEP